jgi:hypothetical protein
VYFECRHGFWYEDIVMEERTTSPNSLRFSSSAGNSLAGLENKKARTSAVNCVD